MISTFNQLFILFNSQHPDLMSHKLLLVVTLFNHFAMIQIKSLRLVWILVSFGYIECEQNLLSVGIIIIIIIHYIYTPCARGSGLQRRSRVRMIAILMSQ
jgi:hypothetical protein